jgi:hypothetical protein
MARSGPGRPTKYNKRRADAYISTLRIGGTHVAAAASAGISEATAFRWRNENAIFASRVDEAIPLREAAWCSVIHRAIMKGDAKVAIQMLRMTNPESYGVQRVKMDGPVEVAGKLELTGRVDMSSVLDNMTTEALQAALDKLQGAAEA